MEEEGEDVVEERILVLRTHMSSTTREAEAEAAFHLVGAAVGTGTVQVVAVDMPPRRARHQQEKKKEIVKLHCHLRSRTFNNRTMKTQMPKSASFAPHLYSTPQSHRVTTVPATSALSE